MGQTNTKPRAKSSQASSKKSKKSCRSRFHPQRKWPIVLCILLATFLSIGFISRNILRQNVFTLQKLIDQSPLFQNSAFVHNLLFAVTGIPINSYDRTMFQPVEDGRITYTSNHGTALQGIDVSSYQGNIDWKRVAADGIDFAMIRVAFRSYDTNGDLYPDTQFKANLQGAIDAGLPVGVYIFSQAITVEEAIEEANFVLECIRGYDIQYPICFDWEPFSKQNARTDGLSPKELTECCKAFCEVIQAAGYKPMVYFNYAIGLRQYYLPNLTQYDFWFAQYNVIPTFYATFHMWQYSDCGQVDGISGKVDLNLSFVDYASQ